MELEKRLGLYQVFLKIYEHNQSLLDEILQLENSTPVSLSGKAPAYVQGVVEGQQAYIITNLANGITQKLFQPQKVWVLGRDPHTALPIRDRWMSRRHAAIQYVHNEGFYLIDLNSTNGSFVNGEPVFQRQLLHDGDLIRLGGLAISFFSGETAQNLAPLSPDLLAQVRKITPSPIINTHQESFTSLIDENEEFSPNNELEDRSIAIRSTLVSEELTSPSSLPNQSIQSQRSLILERFLGKRKTTTGRSIGERDF